MVITTLALAGIYGVAVSFVYALAGRLAWKRRQEGRGQLAGGMFAIWWWALGLATFVGALMNLAGSTGDPDFTLVLSLSYFNLWLVLIGLAGLLFYLVYVYTGRMWTIYPIFGGYFLLYVWLVYIINENRAIGVDVRRWSVQVEYEKTLDSTSTLVFVLALILPTMIASVAYFLLAFRFKEREIRYRIFLIAPSLFVWFGASLAASLAGVSQQDWWQVTSRIISFTAALFVVLAFDPPAWVRKRFQLDAPLDSQST
jgi:hypothetical protein